MTYTYVHSHTDRQTHVKRNITDTHTSAHQVCTEHQPPIFIPVLPKPILFLPTSCQLLFNILLTNTNLQHPTNLLFPAIL